MNISKDHLTLDKKYRPTCLDEMMGNDSTITAIRAAFGRPKGFYSTTLLQGPSGCGKTTLARIIANELGAKGSDCKELNISNMRGIDAARSIIDLSKIAPWGDCRVIILNECHKATNEFQNAMLMLLEEPPLDNYFILCTTEPTKLLRAVKNRCTAFALKPVQQEQLVRHLFKITKKEQITAQKDILVKIAKNAEGCPRQALVMLDAIKELDSEQDQSHVIMGYEHVTEKNVFDLYMAIINKKPWHQVAETIKAIKEKSPEDLRYALLALFERDILSGGKKAERAVMLLDFFATSFQFTGCPGLTQACYLALKV